MSAPLKCEDCSAVNPAEAAFCMSCGAPLALVCAACGAGAPAGARFCPACGTELRAARDAAADERASAPPSEERRTVTVLFADVCGYTALAEQLDHETVKRLLERFLTRLAQEVEHFGGRVDKYIGDNVMAVFGAPVAHEDDATRAIHAALAMQRAMGELNDEVGGELGLELSLRIGVNTGEVLAGRVGEDYTVMGDAVNVAARLQAAAPLGGILVGARTHRLSERAIAYRELEPLQLKGKAEPVAAWEALEARRAAAPDPGELAATSLVGREAELRELQRAFDRVATAGTAHLFTIVGQAGVGKTRLVTELQRHLHERDPEIRVRWGRCLALGAGAAYWPLIEMLRAECSISEADDAATVRAKLDARIAPLLGAREQAAAAERRIAPIALLLGAGELAGVQHDEQSAREVFFSSVRAVLESLAAERPVVLAWEDIHWADESTLDLIEYLARWLQAPVLQICLARDELVERRPGWTTVRRTATAAFLEPLAAQNARRLVEALLEAAGAAGEDSRELAERSGGNPLFAEAIVRRVAEAGETRDGEMPETIQGLLAAQLDALPPFERQLVSHASVLGRTFWESALAPAARDAPDELPGALGALLEKDILAPAETEQLAGERELAFKHVLIRDVAYEMLPRAVRARKHAEVAEFIEERAGAEGAVALVAEHYERAVRLGAEALLPSEELAALRIRALTLSEAAGDAAAALYSNGEALAHYEAAAAHAGADANAEHRIAERIGDMSLRLGRVERAIACWERCVQHGSELGELEHVADLHRKIGAALAHEGARKEAIAHHQEGIRLIKDAPSSLTLVRLYEEAAWLYMHLGENMLAIYASEKALRLAEELGEPGAASRAHGIFGRVFGRIGDAAKARENLERAVELARESDASETVLALLALGHDLEHTEGGYAAADERYREALSLSERIGDVPAQIELHAALGQLAFQRCDWDAARAAADAGAALAQREGLVRKACLPNVLAGRLLWREGDWEASAQLLGAAHELAQQAGWLEVSADALVALAQTRLDAGESDGALAALELALAACDRAGLATQAVQVHSAIARAATLAGERERAGQAAAQARAVCERVPNPAGAAAALEAEGVAGLADDPLGALSQASARWEGLGRPLDVARCELLIALELRRSGSAEGAAALESVAARFAELGLEHLARRAGEQATAARAG